MPFMAVVERGFTFVVAEVVEGEVVDAAEQPSTGIFDIRPVGVEFEESLLDEVFGGFPLADEAVGIAEQWGFLRCENLVEGGFLLHRVSQQEYRFASGFSLGPGSGGLGFHESARA